MHFAPNHSSNNQYKITKLNQNCKGKQMLGVTACTYRTKSFKLIGLVYQIFFIKQTRSVLKNLHCCTLCQHSINDKDENIMEWFPTCYFSILVYLITNEGPPMRSTLGLSFTLTKGIRPLQLFSVFPPTWSPENLVSQ